MASMKRVKYELYIQLCQNTAEVLYAKCNCKHMDAALYQLVNYKELNIKMFEMIKPAQTASMQWHVPGEAPNIEATLFSDLNFKKADVEKDKNILRKRPIVAGKRRFC